MATIRDTILEYPSVEEMEGYLTKVVSVNRGVDLGIDYTVEHRKQVELCVADVYAMLVNSPDFTENRLSITHPRSYYVQTAKRLYLANGEPEKVAGLTKRITVKGTAGSRW